MHGKPGQSPRPMFGDRFGGSLLQRLVSEEPVRCVGEFGCGLTPQQRGFHQDGGTVTETVTHGGDVGDSRGNGEPKPVDLDQIPRARRGPQIGDVVETEGYDGLTPVTMTL
jgi:hypothetical protein